MSEKWKAQVIKVMGVKPGKGETPESYTKRVFDKIDKISEAVWDNDLDNGAQEWVNEQIRLKNDIDRAKAEKREYEGKPRDWLTPPNASEGQAVQPEPTDDSDVEAESEGAETTPEDEAEQEDEVLHANESPKSKKASGSKAKKAAVAKPAKKEAAPKVKKAAKKKEGGEHRGRKALFAREQKIKLLVKENPHRKDTGRWKRWPKYRNGMTVGEALDAGFDLNNLRYSVEDKHIDIH